MDSERKPTPERMRFRKDDNAIPAMSPVWSAEDDKLWQTLLANYFRDKPHIAAIGVLDRVSGKSMSLTSIGGSVEDGVNLIGSTIELAARGIAHHHDETAVRQWLSRITDRLRQVTEKLQKDKPWENDPKT